MTSTTMARLQECDLMLANICTHYGTLLKQLDNAQPGYPTRTPGSGEPGAGKGFTAGSSTERLAGQWSPELDDMQLALALPEFILNAAWRAAEGMRLEDLRSLWSVTSLADRRTINHLRRARVLVHWMVEQDHPVGLRALRQLHANIANLDRITRRWPTPAVPKTTATNKLADDPTELWCRNCLNIGAREPRWRTHLCRWCYEFNAAEGFLPPAALLRIRQAKPRVTQRDVEPYIRAHNERNKKKRRKAG